MMVTLFIYLLFSLTDYNENSLLRDATGMCLLSTVFATMLVNIAYTGVNLGKACKQKYCRRD